MTNMCKCGHPFEEHYENTPDSIATGCFADVVKDKCESVCPCIKFVAVNK